MEQGEEVPAGAYQVRMCQEAVKQSTVGQCKKASAIEGNEEDLEPDGLLLEGEEQEYFLELLMRTALPERPKESHPAVDKGDLKKGAATAKGKEKKRNSRKEREALEKSKAEREADEQKRKGRRTKPTG
jgi:hypothetical protein